MTAIAVLVFVVAFAVAFVVGRGWSDTFGLIFVVALIVGVFVYDAATRWYQSNAWRRRRDDDDDDDLIA